MRLFYTLCLGLLSLQLAAQDYFLKKYKPFEPGIQSPEEFLGYGIGEHHTRHDRIVSYLEYLASVSDRATIQEYGRTHEQRKLVILTVSAERNMADLDGIRSKHLSYMNPSGSPAAGAVPIFVNLGYNVHGNEPSSSEAAMLSAYTLVASENPEIIRYRESSVVFIDPTINPDGRDRHTQWVSTYQGNPLVADPQDAEHNEYWPRGRTNHYWFDLNRDWLLGINPESRGKLNWYHNWYPNVVTDFHEMGTGSTYFFEPMKDNGSLNPIMPKENYVDLNNAFGEYFASALDSIGSLYFTKEIFDGTYPGYGSSYPDLQGGLGLLFEQASSRGHLQKTAVKEITFPFTIRNQFVSSITTVKAAVEQASTLRDYQRKFFQSAMARANNSRIKGYEFWDDFDRNRVKAFIDKLLLHRIEVYKTGENRFMVPTAQPQYRMVQTAFETYDRYRDSVFYDASAWSLANIYNMKYRSLPRVSAGGVPVTNIEDLYPVESVQKASYAYLISGDDYNVPAVLNFLQENDVMVGVAFKPFRVKNGGKNANFSYGSLVIPNAQQELSSDKVFEWVAKAQKKFEVSILGVNTGYSLSGIDLGSVYVRYLEKPKAAMFVGNGVSSYEAGEVWHLLDTRVHKPITKIPIRNFDRSSLTRYSTIVMVSGGYKFSEKQIEKIKTWVADGNTLITLGTASKWVVEKKLVKEKLLTSEVDSTKATVHLPYADARENLGREEVGGVILRADIDRTHPIGFGYRDSSIPVYKNNEVWLKPTGNAYATVAKYNKNGHIDGYLSPKNRSEFLAHAASVIVSKLGGGRVILFADNPNFRGSWYGTNRLFLNALFLGDEISIPE